MGLFNELPQFLSNISDADIFDRDQGTSYEMWPIWMRSTPLFVASIVISLSTVNWMAVYILCCFWCKNYRKTLRTLVSRSDKQSEKDSKYPSSNTPFQYLNSPEKAIRYQRGHELRRSCQRKLALESGYGRERVYRRQDIA